jgi:hypothetical protein
MADLPPNGKGKMARKQLKTLVSAGLYQFGAYSRLRWKVYRDPGNRPP